MAVMTIINFAREIKPTKIFFFFLAVAVLKIQQQNAYRGNNDTSDNLPHRLQAL